MAAKKYLDKISQLNCVVCRHLELANDSPAEIHHVQTVRNKFSDYAVVPLCQMHHRGKNGVHGLSRKGFETKYKLSQIDLLALTNYYRSQDEI